VSTPQGGEGCRLGGMFHVEQWSLEWPRAKGTGVPTCPEPFPGPELRCALFHVEQFESRAASHIVPEVRSTLLLNRTGREPTVTAPWRTAWRG
jgi:hypothetical protein